MRTSTQTKVMLYLLLLPLVMAVLAMGAVVTAEPMVPYYEQTQAEPLAQGATYEKHLRFDRNGWLTFHVVRMNGAMSTLKADVLTANGQLSTPTALSQTAAAEGAIAAINGDFFFVGESNSPLGPVVKGGQLLSTPSYRSDLAALAIDQKGLAQVGYWSWQGSLKLPTGQELTLAGLNKQGYDYAQPMVYDKAWGEQSPGSPGPGSGHVEIVVRNGKVAEIRRDLAKTAIPTDGFVVVARQGAGTTLSQLKIGDVVQLTIATTPDWRTLRTAIGGGTVLVKDGQIAPFTHDTPGRNPRSAIGISRDGKSLLLVAVDGRIPLSRGATQTELAQLLIDLGAYQAINLDGGGSTTLVTRSLDQAMVVRNQPSDGQERRVPNGLGIFSTAAKGPLANLKLSASLPTVLPGGETELKLVGFDTNYNPVDLPLDKVQWQVEPATAGQVVNNRFQAKTAGLTQLSARIGSIQTSITIRVINPTQLRTEPQSIQASWSTSQTIRLVAMDQDGWSAPVPDTLVTGLVAPNLGTWSNGVYTAPAIGSGEQRGVITFTVGDLQSTVPVTVGEHEVLLDDFSQPATRSFIGYPQGVMGSVRLSEGNEPRYNGATGKLSFYLPSLANTRAAYISYGSAGLTLPQGSRELRLWVNGYHSAMPTDTWLRAALIDAQGNKQVLDLARYVDWDGWRQLRVAIPASWPQPLVLDRLYVVEPQANRVQMGAIYLDELSVVVAGQSSQTQSAWQDPRARASLATGVHLVVTGNVQLPSQGSLSSLLSKAGLPSPQAIVTAGTLTRGSGTAVQTEPSLFSIASKQEVKTGGYRLLTLNARQGGLAATDPTQWNWLSEQLKKKQDQPLLLASSLAPGAWQDSYEADLLKQVLSQWAADNNQTVWLMSPGEATKVQAVDGLRLIEIGSQDVIGLSLDSKNTHYTVKTMPKP